MMDLWLFVKCNKNPICGLEYMFFNRCFTMLHLHRFDICMIYADIKWHYSVKRCQTMSNSIQMVSMYRHEHGMKPRMNDTFFYSFCPIFWLYDDYMMSIWCLYDDIWCLYAVYHWDVIDYHWVRDLPIKTSYKHHINIIITSYKLKLTMHEICMKTSWKLRLITSLLYHFSRDTRNQQSKDHSK